MVVALYAPDLAAWPKAAVGPFIPQQQQLPDPHAAADSSSCCVFGEEEYAMSPDVRLLLVSCLGPPARKHKHRSPAIHARRVQERRAPSASRSASVASRDSLYARRHRTRGERE
jgi:hypothetical protein